MMPLFFKQFLHLNRFALHYHQLHIIINLYIQYLNFLLALPESVKNLTLTTQEHDIVLTWLPPSNIDNRSLKYEIVCLVYCLNDRCKKDRCKGLKFIPSRQEIVHTNVTITGFRNEGLLYVFEVRAMVGSYESSENILGIQWNFVAINYTGMDDLYFA